MAWTHGKGQPLSLGSPQLLCCPHFTPTTHHPQRALAAAPVSHPCAGRQATVRFRESQEHFKPLFHRLLARSLHPEMVAGIKLMVDAIKDRNYLHAYKVGGCSAVGGWQGAEGWEVCRCDTQGDAQARRSGPQACAPEIKSRRPWHSRACSILTALSAPPPPACPQIYMGIAVGNSPWPIGVTQVGLHERAAREKISFKGSQGQVGRRCSRVGRRALGRAWSGGGKGQRSPLMQQKSASDNAAARC